MYREGTRLLDLAYRYQAFTYNQVDGSFSTNIAGPWGLAARVRYSLSFHEFLDAFGGVTYETCCVAIRGTYRRYLADINGDYTSGVFFQVEFKGLTHVGSGFSSLLPYDGTDITQIGKRR
jgi:LPS-assembly protein